MNSEVICSSVIRRAAPSGGDGNADEAFDLLGHADERVHRLAVAGAHEMERQREAEIGNERERMGGIDGERRQHREDVAQEMIGEPGPIGLLERLRLDQDDVVGGEFGAQLAPPHLLVDRRGRIPLR